MENSEIRSLLLARLQKLNTVCLEKPVLDGHAIVIQKNWRSYSDRQTVRQMRWIYLNYRVCKIQSLYRGFQVRLKLCFTEIPHHYAASIRSNNDLFSDPTDWASAWRNIKRGERNGPDLHRFWLVMIEIKKRHFKATNAMILQALHDAGGNVRCVLHRLTNREYYDAIQDITRNHDIPVDLVSGLIDNHKPSAASRLIIQTLLPVFQDNSCSNYAEEHGSHQHSRADKFRATIRAYSGLM